MFRFILLALLVAFGSSAVVAASHGAALQFQSDQWQLECDIRGETTDRDCSINGVFRNTSPDGTKGSFSLLIDIANSRVVVVGEPNPTKATVRVDKNPLRTCAASPHCIFSAEDSAAISKELEAGSLILIDVFDPKHTFRSSLSTKGYRASIAKILAQGIR